MQPRSLPIDTEQAAHPIDPYLSRTQRAVIPVEEKDRQLAEILAKFHSPDIIPQPPEPNHPGYENPDYVPFHPHTWVEDEDDYYLTEKCSTCLSYRDDETDEFDCWRELANSRNLQKDVDHRKALKRYEAQMDYWKTLVGWKRGA